VLGINLPLCIRYQGRLNYKGKEHLFIDTTFRANPVNATIRVSDDMDTIHITFDSSPKIVVDRGTFVGWFPNHEQHIQSGKRLEADEIARMLERLIFDRAGVRVPSANVEKVVRRTFETMKRNHFAGGWPPEAPSEKLTRMMADVLQHDKYDDTPYRSRAQFLVLCFAASLAHSSRLAKVLITFLSEFMPDILEAESPVNLHEWASGIRELQGLVSDVNLYRLQQQLAGFGNHIANKWRNHGYYHDAQAAMMRAFMEAQQNPYLHCHRGRAPLAIGSPASWYPRARSLPLVRRRRSRDMRIELPIIPSSAWTSPVMSPVGYARGNYFDEMENLQFQNVEMNAKLDNISDKVDMLVYRG
jgi:hypothetical protein